MSNRLRRKAPPAQGREMWSTSTPRVTLLASLENPQSVHTPRDLPNPFWDGFRGPGSRAKMRNRANVRTARKVSSPVRHSRNAKLPTRVSRRSAPVRVGPYSAPHQGFPLMTRSHRLTRSRPVSPLHPHRCRARPPVHAGRRADARRAVAEGSGSRREAPTADRDRAPQTHHRERHQGQGVPRGDQGAHQENRAREQPGGERRIGREDQAPASGPSPRRRRRCTRS